MQLTLAAVVAVQIAMSRVESTIPDVRDKVIESGWWSQEVGLAIYSGFAPHLMETPGK